MSSKAPPESWPRTPETDQSVLVEQFIRWLAVERGRAANTVSAYRRDLDKYLAWLDGEQIALPEVKVSHVAAFVRFLQAEGAKESSVARRLAAVRMFHGFCEREGTLESDPTRLSEGVRVPSGVPKPLSEEDVERVLVGVTGRDPQDIRDRALLELLYATGARISEACGLDLGDIDFESGLVRFLGKGSKERVVPVGRTARTVLLDYLSGIGRPLLVPVRWHRTDDKDALFLTNRGRRLTRQKAWSVVREAGRRAGVGEDLSPHVLRHSCATHMLDHGADLRVVQEMLGHASISTTQIYTKVSSERLFSVYRTSHPRAEK